MRLILAICLIVQRIEGLYTGFNVTIRQKKDLYVIRFFTVRIVFIFLTEEPEQEPEREPSKSPHYRLTYLQSYYHTGPGCLKAD